MVVSVQLISTQDSQDIAERFRQRAAGVLDLLPVPDDPFEDAP